MVDVVIEFMTTRHGYKPLYGWFIFITAVSAIVGPIAASGARSRRQANRLSARAEVSKGDLYAEVTTTGPTSRRVQAKLREVGGVLELTLVDSAKPDEAAAVKTFNSIQEVEAYLEGNSILRLGDLRTRVQ